MVYVMFGNELFFYIKLILINGLLVFFFIYWFRLDYVNDNLVCVVLLFLVLCYFISFVVSFIMIMEKIYLV